MSATSSAGFDGLRVVTFESRMAGPMAELIQRQGGEPVAAPSMREIPIAENTEAVGFAEALCDGAFDVVIFLTGVGTRYLAQAIETRITRARWVEALGRVEVVARGPKPLGALRELGARVDLAVPEPNTWHEVLAALDARRDLSGARVAVQEYGQPSVDLVEGLRQRGAVVRSVPVYRWALPEDTGPLRRAIAEIAAGRVGAVLFTSAQQVVHALQVAREELLEVDLRDALRGRVVIGSVGPTTSETLMEQGLAADIEPEHPKMGPLVLAVAQRWRETAKRPGPGARVEVIAEPGEVESAAAAGVVRGTASTSALDASPFLRACRGEPTDVTPIWLMRQAGRYMADYRELRSRVSFLELCKRPELATEVTVTAAERLGVDAAILFADILLILEPMGFDLEFSKGEGPVIHNPVRTAADVDRVRAPEGPEPLPYVTAAVRQIRAALPAGMPLIGFAGAPFTLACYAIEGGASRHYDSAKRFFLEDSGAWNALMGRLTDATAVYLTAQALAGAQVLQVFDSWVGALGPDDYREHVLPHMRRLFAALPAEVPVIHFGTGTGGLLELQREAGGQVIGLDWRIELDRGWQRLGPGVGVQGNLDPVVLLGPIPEIERQARRILDRAGGRAGHIFNLGHGILPTTPVDHVKALVEFVHETTARAGG
jgi:uroporphyrinogen decarboxylase